MKDYLKQLISERKTGLPERGIVREYLQARILQSLQDSGAFLDWVFHGGTALRFLYSIPRYSEDLDFALVDPARSHRFQEHLAQLKTTFEAENYTAELKVNDRKTVVSAFVRFPGLLHELGISPHQTEVISVKIEVDTNPPPGAITETTLIRKYVTLNLCHHDRASLLAGKVNAVLMREYTKGRDLYDLVWYLADRTWPPPNLNLLNAGLIQTGWEGPVATPSNWRQLLADRLEKVRWEQAISDVRPFLERQSDLNIITKDNCLNLLREKR
ncbi:MAG: nucleotidyl transferase AbiEii/AbiGii toxin family protein [PVC group bacterium]